MSRSRRPPLTVVAYVVVMAAVAVVAVVDAGADPWALALAALVTPSLVLLWLGVRIAWIGVIGFQAVNLVVVVAGAGPLVAAPFPIAMLALLLAPPSRVYFRRDPNRVRRKPSLARRALIWGFAAWVLLVAIVAGAALLLRPDPVSGDLGLVHSDRPGLRVLFVGNTITSDNEMPEMLSALARGDPGAPPIFTVWYARRGSTLEDALDDDRLRELFDDERWDYVVLQEHSQIASRPPELRERTVPAARALDRLAKKRGARTLLFESWGYRDGDPDSTDDRYYDMQVRMIRGYAGVSLSLLAPVVQVGHVWQQAVARYPRLQLWNEDGRRPTPLGSFLTASVFYAVLTGRDPTRSSFTGGWDPAEARWTRSLAADLVSDQARLR
jgi:hypothetical protein